MNHHAIRIEPSGDAFAVRGAVSCPSSRQPVIDAAKALKTAGASDLDLIVANGSVVTISPVTIGRVLDYRPSHARRAIDKRPYGEARFNQ